MPERPPPDPLYTRFHPIRSDILCFSGCRDGKRTEIRARNLRGN